MREIRIAIAGVGNLCSAFIQGIHHYNEDGEELGVLSKQLGSYGVNDIDVVAAFDIDTNKVSLDLSEAIFAKPNKAPKFHEVSELGIKVKMGPAPDEVQEESLSQITKSDAEPVDLVRILKDSQADMLVNIISGGSEKASELYARACIKAGCGYINATPAHIVNSPKWRSRFFEAKVPAAGDDLLDQVGATAVHLGLIEFLDRRGVIVDESYQLDVGGGTESINTLERTRERKRLIKTEAVSKSVPYKFPLVSGSTDFVDFLGNTRDSFFWIKGHYYFGAPFSLDVKLNTVDSANGGAILIDCIRALKIALDRNIRGVIKPICHYGFKTGERRSLVEALSKFRRFVEDQ